ncbi:hypothetical protein [Oryzobacter terrae]|uniref:hypothetical protein n=1 Tax=Oryzobacter terrae TaxID=1620385 RepID=UPI00366BC282
MTPTEPNDTTMDRAREDHRAAGEARAEKRIDDWRGQASEIEDGMADAVERATAMGDRVERSTLPADRRPEGAEATSLPSETGPRQVDPDGERRGSPRDDA